MFLGKFLTFRPSKMQYTTKYLVTFLGTEKDG